MATLKTRSKRERMLVMMLVGALAVAGYLMFRVGPANDAIRKMDDTAERMEKRYQKLLERTRSTDSTAGIKREIKQYEDELAAIDERMAALDLHFADLSTPGALQAVQVRVTELADSLGLQVLGRSNDETTLMRLVPKKRVVTPAGTPPPPPPRSRRTRNVSAATAAANAAAALATARFDRPLFRLKLRGSFYSTYAFIDQLHALESSVLIARFKLSADDQITGGGARLLTTDLMLAL